VERYKVDVVIIGAGVVGIAVANALSKAGRSVWLVEQDSAFGRYTSSRNSEVIHAGIYYPKNSLKAQLCVRGKALLYDYSATHLVPFKQCGKLIVASTPEQASRLERICEQGRVNGVDDLQVLNANQVRELEPDIECESAILSPSTGVIDSHSLMQTLLNESEVHGATFVPNTDVSVRRVASNQFELELLGQDTLVESSVLINSAGLFAPSLLKGVAGFEQALIPTAVFAKGSYFSYGGSTSFRHLIYPVPEEGGLGVHLTLDLGGAARFGPDVEWCGELTAEELKSFDYKVSPAKRDQFAQRIRQYWPKVDASKLRCDYSGLRPKIKFDNNIYSDFCIQTQAAHGINGLINLFGIESPGLTSSLAIGEYVASKVV